jgi:hypothetical protein
MMRTDRDGAPLASVDAEDAAQQADENAKIAENPAPYDVLTARVALVEAAKLNRRAVIAMEAACDRGEPEGSYYDHGLLVQAATLAQIARSLSTYALALSRWNT